jgi:chromosome segregation ATPase
MICSTLVQGFKSFDEEGIRVDFETNFAAICGENGCGKSNFVEAIAFAFGERKDRMRVENLEELFHESHGKRAPMIRVLISFQGVPHKVETRLYARSTQRIYRVGRRIVSLRSLEEFLKQVGASSQDGYTFFRQLMPNLIELLRPREIWKTFERSTGVSSLSSKTDHLLKIMTHMRSNYVGQITAIVDAWKRVESAVDEMSSADDELESIIQKRKLVEEKLGDVVQRMEHFSNDHKLQESELKKKVHMTRNECHRLFRDMSSLDNNEEKLKEVGFKIAKLISTSLLPTHAILV